MISRWEKVASAGPKVGIKSTKRRRLDNSGRRPQARWREENLRQRYAGFALDGNDWDGIHAGDRKPMDLVYAGEVGHGFDRARRADQPKGVIRHLVVRLDGGLHCR